MVDFSLEPRFVREAFDQVMQGVAVTAGLKADLYDLWLPAVRSGDPRETRNALFIHLGHDEWRWPYLDQWAEVFRDGPWPAAWAGWIAQPYDWNSIALDMKLQLLSGELEGRAYAVRRFEQMLEPSTQAVYRIALHTTRPECPIEQRFITLHGPSIEAGDYGVLPPFFPWSATALRPVSRRRGV